MTRTAQRNQAPSATPTESLATPEQYNAFIEGVELKGFRLANCEIDARSRYTGKPLRPIVSEEGTSFRPIEDGFLVFASLKFSGAPMDGQGPAVTIRATFELEYSAKTPIDEALFAVFRRYNLPVNVWPFFREFVHTVLARANWPVFTLPALKIPAAGTPRRERTRSQA